MKLKEYQKILVSQLEGIFPNIPVKAEWSAMKGDSSLYCPRLDVAVGPFAVDNIQYTSRYNSLMNNHRQLIDDIIHCHKQNVESISWEKCNTSFEELKYKNPNARCLLAIEIENKVSRKHLIGGAINAAALGRVGIVVAWTPEKLKAFIKLRRYLNFLGSVGKNTFDTTNLVILDAAQLMSCIENALK